MGVIRWCRKILRLQTVFLRAAAMGLNLERRPGGGYENVTFSNSVIFNDNVDYRARVISGIDIAIVDGGYIDGVVISNIRMQRVRTPIFVPSGIRRPTREGLPGYV